MEQKRWALVSGADRGVGASLAKGLLERGYHVFAGLNREKGRRRAASGIAGEMPGTHTACPKRPSTCSPS